METMLNKIQERINYDLQTISFIVKNKSPEVSREIMISYYKKVKIELSRFTTEYTNIEKKYKHKIEKGVA